MAELWLTLGSNHAMRALALIHSAFPIILGHGGLELRARAYITEAKCHLADKKFSGFLLYLLHLSHLFLYDSVVEYRFHVWLEKASIWKVQMISTLESIELIIMTIFPILLFVSVNEDPELVLEPLRQAAEELELLEVS